MMWKPVTIAIVLLFAWLYFYEPSKVVVATSGNVSGVYALQSFIQGNKFWHAQNKVAHLSLQRLIDQPRSDAAFDVETQRMNAQFSREDAALCAKNIDLCFPPKTVADNLRDKADELDANELKREMEVYRQQRMVELREIISVIEQRTE
jgi:hypothetical protein